MPGGCCPWPFSGCSAQAFWSRPEGRLGPREFRIRSASPPMLRRRADETMRIEPMASYLFVSALQPTIPPRWADAPPEPIDLCVTSPSPAAHDTATRAMNGRWVFTVDEPLLAAREQHESIADVMARYAQALRVIAAYDTRSALVVCDELG